MSGFDVEAYIGNYQGFTRVKRMGFISGQNSALKADVLRTAVDEVKKTTNTVLYIELITMAGDTPGLGARDDAWVEAEDKKAAHRLEKLENDLSQQKTSLVKESIRMGHNDLGDFHSARGDFVTALKCYVRTRDYCTTPKHIVSMCLNVIRVSIHMGESPKPRTRPHARDPSQHGRTPRQPPPRSPPLPPRIHAAPGPHHRSHAQATLRTSPTTSPRPSRPRLRRPTRS